MKLEKEKQLFFGTKVDSKLREALALAKPGDRKYFEDPDAGFLRIVTMQRPDKDKLDRWIGKTVKSGIGCGDVEDIQRNVVSILRRIAPEIRTNPATIKIFVIDDSQPAEAVSLDAVGDDDDEVVSSGDGESGSDGGSESGGGPYIDY